VGEIQLITGDILIMMSDGIFEGAQHVEKNMPKWATIPIVGMQAQ
ncbi:SpoIIE family protein phosphatase, partial [Bacillus sp. D-CC]